jgi:hypothetical protein
MRLVRHLPLRDGPVTPTANLINNMHEEVSVLTGLLTDLQDPAQLDRGDFHRHPTLQPLELLNTYRLSSIASSVPILRAIGHRPKRRAASCKRTRARSGSKAS